MRQIGTIEGEAAARKFSDLLDAEGFAHDVEPADGGAFAIWVHDEDRIAAARETLDRFRADPGIADTPDVAARAQARRREQEKLEAAAKQRQAGARPRLTAGRGTGPLTIALVLPCVALALHSRFQRPPDEILHWLTIVDYQPIGGGLIRHETLSETISSGEVWRLLTPAFVHFSPLHIFFNLWWLVTLGSAIERHHGLRVYVPLLLLTAVGANLFQYWFGPGIIFGGMSGVVYGLLGYVWIRGKLDPLSGLHLPPNIVMLMILWFFLGVFGVIGNIANYAHGAGLGLGMAFGYVLAKLFPSYRLR